MISLSDDQFATHTVDENLLNKVLIANLIVLWPVGHRHQLFEKVGFCLRDSLAQLPFSGSDVRPELEEPQFIPLRLYFYFYSAQNRGRSSLMSPPAHLSLSSPIIRRPKQDYISSGRLAICLRARCGC